MTIGGGEHSTYCCALDVLWKGEGQLGEEVAVCFGIGSL